MKKALAAVAAIVWLWVPVVHAACLDSDGDEYFAYQKRKCPSGNDCNDSDFAINPGAPEACDGIDNNCNGVVDEGCFIRTVTHLKTLPVGLATVPNDLELIGTNSLALSHAIGLRLYTNADPALSSWTYVDLDSGQYSGVGKDKSGNLLAIKVGFAQINRWRADGRRLRSIPITGEARPEGRDRLYMDIFQDPVTSNYYLTDNNNSSFVVVNKRGVFVAEFPAGAATLYCRYNNGYRYASNWSTWGGGSSIRMEIFSTSWLKTSEG